MDSPHWRALWIGDGFNPRVRADALIASGAYAIRDKDSHVVRYVGESSRGALWKTLLRHFQAPASFRRVRESGVFTGDPRNYEVALHVTSKGHRPRPPAETKESKRRRKKKGGPVERNKESKRLRELKRRGVPLRTEADQRASEAQAVWIARLQPTKNKDDGLANVAEELRATRARQEAEDRDDPFGLLNPGPKPQVSAKALRELASGDLDGREHTARAMKLLQAADRAAEREARATGDRAASNARNDDARAAIIAAREAGDIARAARYEREIAALRASARAAQPVPGTYEHELAVMRARSGNPPALTFAQARSHMLATMMANGWQVASALKVPHATAQHPKGGMIRVWFFPQTMKVQRLEGRGGSWDVKRARSSNLEIRNDPMFLLSDLGVPASVSVPMPAGLAPGERAKRPRTKEPTAAERPSPEELSRVLRLVEAGFGHSMPIADMSREDYRAASRLETLGQLKRLPSRGRWPARFVVTSAGSHELGSFDSTDRHFLEESQIAGELARERAAKAKPAGYGDVETGKGKRGKGAQLRMFNPAPTGALVELGKLTKLALVSGPALRWSLREAPALAYDDAGRLFIVYTGRVVRSSSATEIREYARSHWGQTGEKKVRGGGVAVGPFVRLSAAKSITYTTRKGTDVALVDYVHPFGEGASLRGFVPPVVVEHRCAGGCATRCAAAGSIALHGGSYRVTSRGIVG